jgi:two-component system, NarL family, sensor histidine kinase UhpB
MREFAIPLLEAKNIDFDFFVSGDHEQYLPMNLRRNAFLIFKESVYNVLKHSGATKVQIRFEVNPNKLLLHIADNGKGFALQQSTNRNGLKNLHSRAEAVGGSIQINPSPTGTVVKFNAAVR